MTRSLVLFATLGLLLADSARAKPTGGADATGSPARLADLPTASAVLARAVKQHLGVDAGVDAWDGNLPAVIVAYVRGLEREPGAHDAQLAKLRKTAERFETAWAAYDARRLEVEAALAAAADKRQAGDLAGAEAALRDAIKPLENKSRHLRGSVDPASAELAIIYALADQLGKAQQWAALIDLVPSVAVRRPVRARIDESVHYLVAEHRDELRRLADAAKKHALGEAIERTRETMNDVLDTARAADGFYAAFSRYGLREIRLVDLSKAAKKGDWIHIPIPKQAIKDGRARLVWDDEYQEGYDCVKTGIRRIKWQLGEIEYEYTCRKWRPVKVHVDVSATLATPVPDWVAADRWNDRVVVVGRVTKAGRAVELSDAFIADVRSIGRPAKDLLHATIASDE